MSAQNLRYGREIIEKALNNKEPERIPIGFGAHCCGIHIQAYKRLRNYLGYEPETAEVAGRIEQTALIDEEIKDEINFDVEGINAGPPSSWEFERLDRGDYWEYEDEFGITWRMPKDDGLYYDMWDHPLSDIEKTEDVKAYQFHDPENQARFGGFDEQFKRAAENGRAPVINPNTGGVFELALWLRGFEKFYKDMIIDVELAEAILDKALEYKKKFWRKALEEAGSEAFIIAEADDIASQNSLLISPEMYRNFVKPRHRELFSYIKDRAESKIYIWYHSCGAVKKLIPDLIEEGVDILNPVQLSSKGMDPKELKEEFGEDIAFWGGGIDTQKSLPEKSPEEVKKETKKNVKSLARNGGYIFAPVHNVQADVPAENFMAMMEGLSEADREV